MHVRVYGAWMDRFGSNISNERKLTTVAAMKRTLELAMLPKYTAAECSLVAVHDRRSILLKRCGLNDGLSKRFYA
jgi:hypothetical protein